MRPKDHKSGRSIYPASTVVMPIDSQEKTTQSVLIVDDEPMARTLLRLMLVRSGYEVIEAEDGYDALRKVQESAPDLVILDVMMPGISGIEVCSSIRNELNLLDLPIILLSAKSDISSVRGGIDVGADKFLVKPVSPEDLTQHVREILDRNKDHQRG